MHIIIRNIILRAMFIQSIINNILQCLTDHIMQTMLRKLKKLNKNIKKSFSLIRKNISIMFKNNMFE